MKVSLKDKQLINFFSQARHKSISLDNYIQNLFNQINDRIINQSDFQISIDDKIALSQSIIKRAFKKFPSDKITIAWTGGKDSTLLLWLVKKVIKKKNKWPQIIFINEGYIFDEIIEFSQQLASDWSFEYHTVQNKDIIKQVKKVGDIVSVNKLNTRNKKELKRLKFKDSSFPFEPESMIGNHLMKTVAQNIYLEKSKTTCLLTGIRWDEQEARSNEFYLSKRGDEHTPKHTRVHPILHFTERDVWQATKQYSIPYCQLYQQGYRSLGAKGTTNKTTDTPAWEQDLENTSEREGRQQDKEDIMKRLRDLGYM